MQVTPDHASQVLKCTGKRNLYLSSDRQLVLPFGVNLALFEEALAFQPLSVGFVAFLRAILFLHIKRVFLDVHILLEFLKVFFRRLEFTRCRIR